MPISIIVAAGVVAFVFIVWLWVSSRRYARVFADANYLELGVGLERLKAAALQRMETVGEETPLGLNDPRVLRTQADLAVVYTISRRAAGDTAPQWVHHLSVGLSGRYTPHRVAAPMIVYILQLLEIDLPRAVVEIAPNHVFHVEWVLDENEQAAFTARPVKVPPPELIRRVHLQCLRRRDDLRLGQIGERMQAEG
ncbi:MAG: hypothetical protein JO316_17220 [Abitibacteriaceae bacterium]|nr:hypothetical protein [Abditibacteriaceae bacterium]